MSKISALLISSVFLTNLFAGVIAGTSLPPEIQKMERDRQVNVILHFTKPLTATQHTTIQNLGGKLLRELNSINSAAYSVKRQALDKILDTGIVDRVALDSPVRASIQ
jgi:hypothetical protein